jgi:hypothetical protein
VEIDVEREEVDEVGDLEVLGGGEVGVADERARRSILHLVTQRAQEGRHALGPVPAHHVGRDLVADEEPEQRRVVAAVVGSGTHGSPDLRDGLAPVEKRDVLRPGNRHQDAHAVLRRPIEQPARRDGEGPQTVGPDLHHQLEIALEHGLLGEREPV